MGANVAGSDNMQAAEELCRWLGLVPSNVAEIVIRVTPFDFRVEVTQVVVDAGALVRELSTYDATLVARPVAPLSEEARVAEEVPSA